MVVVAPLVDAFWVGTGEGSHEGYPYDEIIFEQKD